MRGRNTLFLNTATMIEAVQEYLERRMSADAPTVGGFVAERDERGTGFVYRVDLSEVSGEAGRTTP